MASKARMSGTVCTQEPGTAGLSVGTGLSAASGTVKWTLTPASDGTSAAPGAGWLATTERRPGDAVGVAAAGVGFTRVDDQGGRGGCERAERDDDRGDQPVMPGVAAPASMCGFRHGMQLRVRWYPAVVGSRRAGTARF